MDKNKILTELSKDNDLLLWFQRWLESTRCVCSHCGRVKKETSYYKIKHNQLYKGGRLPICKKCMNDMFNYYYGRYRNKYMAMNKICQLFDIYFDTRLMKSIDADSSSLVGRYLQKLNLRQNKYKRMRGYDGSYLKL